MWLEIWNIRTTLKMASEAERQWVGEYLAFPDESAKYRQLATGQKIDGLVRMFNVMTNTFPTGFVPLIRKAAVEAGFTVEILDKRTAPCAADPEADLGWLRDYQKAAVAAIVTKKRGILWLPTGSGKTEIAVGLTRALPCRWLFLVHRATLLEQTAERYERRTGLPAGRIGDGKFDIPDGCTFIACTFQTASRMMGGGTNRMTQVLTEWAQGIMMDEAHVVPSNSFWNVVMAAHAAYYRVGLSGTPLARGDRKSLLAIAAIGPIAYRIKPDVLIEAGVLSKPDIKLVEVKQKSEQPTWQGVYGANIVRSAIRNKTVVECCRRAEKPCLLFVKEVSHGKLLEKLLFKAGMKAAFTYGNHSTEHRQSQIKTLERGAIDVLICSVIFQEGVDIPDLRSVVIASGGKSIIATLQRIGRGMRVSKGKDGFEVWDIYDKGCGCAVGPYTHAGCKWLEKHTRARVGAYAQEGYQTTMIPPLVL